MFLSLCGTLDAIPKCLQSDYLVWCKLLAGLIYAAPCEMDMMMRAHVNECYFDVANSYLHSRKANLQSYG